MTSNYSGEPISVFRQMLKIQTIAGHGALSPALNSAVISLCETVWPRGFDISEHVPNSFKALRMEFSERGRITVFSGNSGDTIYGDASINHKARAWHDWAHLKLGAGFALNGESAACELQCRQLINLLGEHQGMAAAEILRAEVVGQAKYYEKHKRYVVRQRDFVNAYLNDPQASLEGDF